MSRLLKANFQRLFKSGIFMLCMIFSVALGIFLDIMRYADIQKNSEFYAEIDPVYNSADGFAFSGALYLIFAAAAFIAIFIGTEYSDGTIRNKMTIGYSRLKIYLANLITVVTADIMMLTAFLISVIGFGKILFTVSCLSTEQLIIYTLMQFLSIFSFSAIMLLFAMLITNKSVSAVAILLTTFIMLLSALSIYNALAAPEYEDTGIVEKINQETGETEREIIQEKNPSYLTGTKREVYEFFNNALPVNQMYQIMMFEDENIGVMVLYSCCMIAAAGGIGIAVFNKKDLK